jgi:hypothetical protein
MNLSSPQAIEYSKAILHSVLRLNTTNYFIARDRIQAFKEAKKEALNVHKA